MPRNVSIVYCFEAVPDPTMVAAHPANSWSWTSYTGAQDRDQGHEMDGLLPDGHAPAGLETGVPSPFVRGLECAGHCVGSNTFYHPYNGTQSCHETARAVQRSSIISLGMDQYIRNN